MRKRRNVILGLAITSWLAIACGSGVGALSTIDDGNDPAPYSGRDNPGAGREIPNTTGHEVPPISREVPPPSQDNPGGHGGGAGGGGGGSTCPPCDVKFDCLTGGKKSTISLKTQNGQCSAGDGVTFDCNGKVIQAGVAIGTWSGSGSNYTVTVTSKGQTTTLTCTKSTTTTVPTSTGTGTSTAPTGTTTAVPKDAGFGG